MTGSVATLEQTLHGYDGGHRLLHTSVDLPSDSREIITALSDLSGSRVFPGYDSYLTGYPLPGSDYYVFARTWLAAEMPRPGCVWTHSLLIPFADLAHLRNLSRLTSLHVRPSLTDKGYDKSLSVSVTAGKDSPVVGRAAAMAGPLLRMVYGEGRYAPVIIASQDVSLYEPLLVRVWDQQWPRLRRAFRFCSGAFSNRVVDGHEFDLQVMPIQPARMASHSSSVLGLDIDARQENRNSTRGEARVSTADADAITGPFWMSAMTNDLIVGEPESAFRQWMIIIGAHAKGSRREAGKGLELAALLSAPLPDMDEVVRSLAEQYPAAQSGSNLKAALLGGVGVSTRITGTIVDPENPSREGSVLLALGRSTHPNAFKELVPTIRVRAEHLWRHYKPQAIELLDELLSSSVNELGAEALRGIMAGVGPQEIASVAHRRRGVLFLAVEARPALLEVDAIWRDKSLIYEALQVLHVIPDAVKPPLSAILPGIMSSSPGTVDELFRSYGAEAVTEAAATALQGHAVEIDVLRAAATSRHWQQIASQVLLDGLVKLENSSDPMLFRFLVLAVTPETVRTIPPSRWVKAVQSNEAGLDSPVAAQLLAAALGMDERDAGELVALVFPKVYDAAFARTLAESDWQLVAKCLPPVPEWLDWDRCERMRRGCVHAYASKRKWKYKDFITAFQNLEALRAACAYATTDSRLREFLGGLAKAVDKGKTDATPGQQRIVSEATKGWWKLW